MENRFSREVQIWEKEASKLPWKKKWQKALDWKPPFAKWFVGGEINACEACIDSNISKGRANKKAIIWESENGQKRTLTYRDLSIEVDRWTYALKKLSVKKGDFVAIYMPLIPEAIFAMLSCARIGAIHNVVFAGFSSQALAERINETKAKLVITADYTFRRGKKINLKQTVNEALKNTNSVNNVLFIRRTKDKLKKTKKDIDFAILSVEEPAKTTPSRQKSTNPLFVLYTSGTTGKPKGIVHSTGGYLTQVFASLKWAFAVKPGTIFWCTADIGWITGHSYVVYGPLMHGSTTFIFEGVPDYPNAGKWWELIERYKINVLYTSPTAIRMLMKFGKKWPTKYNLSSLKILGTVGEPINPKAWQWFFEVIGKRKLPIIDTWWQTETGGFMISPRAKTELDKLKPGSAHKSLPGISAKVLNENGCEAKPGQKGYLVITKPWPGMTTTIYRDAKKYKKTYWSKFKDTYFTGDYAVKDKQGHFFILGRADEVIIVAGHNISTIEVENTVISLPFVNEVAAVGIKDEIKGQQIIVFASIDNPRIANIEKKIIDKIRTVIGPIATPDKVILVDKLPKTRSGKILRRMLGKLSENQAIGDTSTLENEEAVASIKKYIKK